MTYPPFTEVEAVLAELCGASTGRLEVLEAGCGSRPRAIDIPGNPYLVGIDISEQQLQANERLDERILGDIQTQPLPSERFQLVFCWDVLEHLARPEDALANLAEATRPDGLVLLKVPNAMSVKGLVTKFTPHAFHVWFYRRVLGRADAHAPDRPPFPTYMRMSIAPHRLTAWARGEGLTPVVQQTWEDDKQERLRRRLRIEGRAWRALRRMVARLSLGRISAAETELLLVLRKGPPPSSSGAVRLSRLAGGEP